MPVGSLRFGTKKLALAYPFGCVVRRADMKWLGNANQAHISWPAHLITTTSSAYQFTRADHKTRKLHGIELIANPTNAARLFFLPTSQCGDGLIFIAHLLVYVIQICFRPVSSFSNPDMYTFMGSSGGIPG